MVTNEQAKTILAEAIKAAGGEADAPTVPEAGPGQWHTRIAINGEIKYEALVTAESMEKLVAMTEEKFGGKVLMVYPKQDAEPLTLGVFVGPGLEQYEHEAGEYVKQQKSLS